jgi:hypothetical protein
MVSSMFVVAFVALACVQALPISSKDSPIVRKALAGPPEEFSSHSLPDPTMGALNSESAAYFITLALDSQNAPMWTRQIAVDSSVGFSINIFSPIESYLTVSLLDPNGKSVPVQQYATQVMNSFMIAIVTFRLFSEFERFDRTSQASTSILHTRIVISHAHPLDFLALLR